MTIHIKTTLITLDIDTDKTYSNLNATEVNAAIKTSIDEAIRLHNEVDKTQKLS